MNLFLLLLLSPSIDFGLQPQHAVVNQKGVILAEENGFTHFDFQGQPIAHIPGSPRDLIMPIGDFYLQQDFGKYLLKAFNRKGKQVQTFGHTGWRSLTQLTDDLFVAVPVFFFSDHVEIVSKVQDISMEPNRFLKIYDPGSDPNPLMINLVHLISKGETFELKPGRVFFRATREQKLLRLNSKKMFIQLEDNVFYIMTGLNESIYIYDDATIQKERLTDPRMPFAKPELKLTLKDFVKSENNIAYPKDIYFDREEYFADRSCWRYNWSNILHFSKNNTGFMVVYSVPNRSENASCDLMDVYIQEVALDGTNIGAPIVIERLKGSFAGLVNQKMYWLSRDMKSKKGTLESYKL